MGELPTQRSALTQQPELPTTLPLQRWSIFLDIDGTLLGLRQDPGAVISDRPLRDLLTRLSEGCEQRLALISGRSVSEIDRIFAPLRFPCAGSHGSEFRASADAPTSRKTLDTETWEHHAQELEAFVAQHQGLLLERKPAGVALHYRRQPDLESACNEQIERIAAGLGAEYRVLYGKKVVELVPANLDKGSAIKRFMELAQFNATTPLFIGDDTTDEPGFLVVNQHAGLSVRVGDLKGSLATHTLADVEAVHEFLQRLLGSTDTPRRRT